MDSLRADREEHVHGLKDSVSNVERKLDVIRAEVKLISQHKLTWQNSTWDNPYNAHFVVDGVNTLNTRQSSDSPVQ